MHGHLRRGRDSYSDTLIVQRDDFHANVAPDYDFFTHASSQDKHYFLLEKNKLLFQSTAATIRLCATEPGSSFWEEPGLITSALRRQMYRNEFAARHGLTGGN